MAKVGYCRVSTADQNSDRQLASLEKAGCDPIWRENASGKTLNRPVLNECLASLQPGDTLVVHELDRLGRSMVQMLTCAEGLLERGVGLITLDGKLNTDVMDPSIVKLIVGILGYAAEMERKSILKRSKEGIEAARARGVKFGPKRTWTDDQAELVRTLYDTTGMGYMRIAKQVGMSVNMVRRILGKGGDYRTGAHNPSTTR